MAPPISISEDTQIGPDTSGGPPAVSVSNYSLEVIIHEDDFAELANADGILTLHNTFAFSGITGGPFYVTLSKLVPVLPPQE